MPFRLGVFLRRAAYAPFFKKMGKNVRIMDAVVIKYPDEMELGNDVTINQFCYLVGKAGLRIGDNCMIGAGTKVTTSGHNFTDITQPMLQQGISFRAITIEDDVWMGFNVVVLGGVKVKNGSILAAGAVVHSGVFEAYSILGGVPAKVIGTRK